RSHRAADERAIQNVSIVGRARKTVRPRAMCRSMMRIARWIAAKPDNEAAIERVLSECVVDLTHAEIVIARLERRIADRIGVHECDERCVRRVTQRTPLIENGLTAGAVVDARSVGTVCSAADRPP